MYVVRKCVRIPLLDRRYCLWSWFPAWIFHRP